MIQKLVQKQLIPHKNAFLQELNKIILNLNLSKYPNRKENKQFTTAQKLSVIILYFRSQKLLIVFCNEFKETKWSTWLELNYKIKKSTLNNWVKLFDLNFLKTILNKTNYGEKPELFGINRTSIDTNFKSRYYKKRLKEFGRKPKSNYHKLDIITDMNVKIKIYNFSFLIKQRHNIYVAWKLLKRFKFKNVVIVVNKDYFNYELFKLIRFKNNYLLFPLKIFRKKCKDNNTIRKIIKENYYKFIDIYHKRSNIKKIFSVLKKSI